jgi:hypothetical protein
MHIGQGVDPEFKLQCYKKKKKESKRTKKKKNGGCSSVMNACLACARCSEEGQGSVRDIFLFPLIGSSKRSGRCALESTIPSIFQGILEFYN